MTQFECSVHYGKLVRLLSIRRNAVVLHFTYNSNIKTFVNSFFSSTLKIYFIVFHFKFLDEECSIKSVIFEYAVDDTLNCFIVTTSQVVENFHTIASVYLL